MDPTFALLIIPFIVLPFVFKHFWPHNIQWPELAGNVAVGIIAVSVVYFVGRYSAASDVEIWNGEITGKTRVHGHYEESYDCNCTTDKDGNRSCQTCYEDHYTVTWDFQSTIGEIRVDHLDRTSRSVYNSPDPAIYKNTRKGDPCSRPHEYTNWVKAVPESLFNTDRKLNPYAAKIPEYPRVYNLIHINRVLAVDASLPPGFQKDLNDELNKRLRNLGPALEMNLVVIITGINDPSYRYAVESAWIGGKKNDAVLFIGVDKEHKITWADVMTFAKNKGNELFHVRMRDALMKVGKLENAYNVADVVSNVALTDFSRISMKEFERLKHEIDPPTWVIVLSLLLGMVASTGFAWFAYHYEYRNGGFYRVTQVGSRSSRFLWSGRRRW